MTKYRKKPVVVEAMQWDGTPEGYKRIAAWVNPGGRPSWACNVVPNGFALLVFTLEGQMSAIKDDWIIRGVKGEFYPCKPDIFEATYEPVGGGSQVRLTKRQREVLEYIGNGFPQPIQAVRLFGIKAYSTIRRLAQRGWIEAQVRGYYHVTSAGRKALEVQP